MEDNFQIFVGVFISIFLLFIFPVYMAFEKKDDIAYALAMRYTQDFVDTVKTKGYITKEMYADYRKQLAVTGNSYDIEMIHEQSRVDPIIQYYKKDENGNLTLDHTTSLDEKLEEDKALIELAIANPSIEIYTYSSEQSKQAFLNSIYKARGFEKIIETYNVTKQTYTTKYIEALLELENKLWLEATTDNFVCVDAAEPADMEAKPKKVNDCRNAYTMNENDMFTVKIKNTNVTPAALIYNMLTGNTIKNNTRVFVNYGGVILNARWYGKIDYTKMKHDNLQLYEMKLQELKYAEEVEYKKDGSVTADRFMSISDGTKDYMIEVEARPYDTTDLQKVGTLISADDVEKYNFLFGRAADSKSLQVSVGINGISMLLIDSGKTMVILSYPMEIDKYTKIRIRVGKSLKNSSRYQVVLFVNDKRVAESLETTASLGIWRIGEGYVNGRVGQFFSGKVRNAKVYYED